MEHAWKVIGRAIAVEKSSVSETLRMIYIRKVVMLFLLSWLFDVPATWKAYLRDGSAQTINVLPHWDGTADQTYYFTQSRLYRHRVNHSWHWPYDARRLAAEQSSPLNWLLYSSIIIIIIAFDPCWSTDCPQELSGCRESGPASHVVSRFLVVSASRSRRQMFLGLTHFLFACGFQVSTGSVIQVTGFACGFQVSDWSVIQVTGFRRICPIYIQRLWTISSSAGFYLVRFQTIFLSMISG